MTAEARSPEGNVVALDVGGTEIKGAIVDHSVHPVHSESRPTHREAGVEAVVRGIEKFGADLAERAGAPVRAVGVVVPGLVDDVHGIARYSAGLGWRDLALRDRLAERFRVPIALDHDVRAGALAEGYLGAGRDVDDFLFLPIGTGIAGGVVLDGRPYVGAGTAAGEIGHMPVVPGGEPCACGQRGCLETYASAAAVTRRYLAAGGAPVEGGFGVVQRARAGDPIAVKVWDEAVDALADALASYTLLLDPALVIVGGGMALAGPALLGPLTDRVRERLLWRPTPPIVAAELGAQSGCLGASIVAWRIAGTPVAADVRR